MYLEQFFVEWLVCASYMVGSDTEGVAAVIDPDREVEKYIHAAETRGLKITHIIETHLHADHVSGNTDLNNRTRAEIYLHEHSAAHFPHNALCDGDILKLGTINLHVNHTPGHTPESITLLVNDTTRSDQPWLALTGDTLFVGDAGRPDLVGAEAARALAGQMHESLFSKLMPLDDSLLIYPGHGAGSLCGRSIGTMRSSTLGHEKSTNPALMPRKKDEFVEYATSNLPEQPGNHKRIKSINQHGPAPLGEIKLKPLTIEESITHFRRGAAMLDTRPKQDFIEKHVPGAVHLEADEQLSNKIGFVLPPELPVVLLVEDEDVYRQVVYSLARVGYDQEVIGYLAESLEIWEAKGLPITSGDIEDISVEQLNELLNNTDSFKPVVLDVREPWEYQQGHIPGAVLVPLGSLSSLVENLDINQPVVVVCATGNRSVSAAALLGRKKFEKIYNVLGGTMAWMQQGLPLER